MGKIKRTDKRKTYYAKFKTRNCFYASSIFGAKDGYIRLSYGKVNINQIEGRYFSFAGGYFGL